MNERAARAYLSHITEPGDKFVGLLVNNLGAVEAVEQLFHNPDHRSRYRPRMMFGLDREKISGWLYEEQNRHQIAFIIPTDADWPTNLDDLDDTIPHGLWVKGHSPALGALNRTPSLAMVGARAATNYGAHVATEWASALASTVPIISGGAYGIDAAAHRGAMAAGGMTIVFSAAGVDRPYPAGHNELFARATEKGCVVSEVPPRSAPTKWRFLARNRLIAAASTATLVVESGWRSGTLNTAQHAVELHRPLGAVPGPITSAASAGANRLIREGQAKLISSAEEAKALVFPELEQDTDLLAGLEEVDRG